MAQARRRNPPPNRSPGQVERHFTEEEIRRIEGRCRQWEQAEQIVSAHPHDPFHAEVLSAMGRETFKAFAERQEAGAEDILVTRQSVEAGKLLDIETLDHLILGGHKFVSLREKGLGFSC